MSLTNTERATAFAMVMLRLRDASTDAQNFGDHGHWEAARDALHVGRELFQKADEIVSEAIQEG